MRLRKLNARRQQTDARLHAIAAADGTIEGGHCETDDRERHHGFDQRETRGRGVRSWPRLDTNSARQRSHGEHGHRATIRQKNSPTLEVPSTKNVNSSPSPARLNPAIPS